MKLKLTITAFAAVFAIMTANAQTNATNWTAQDCNSVSHTLFDKLDSGKVVVMVWVMPCGSCVNGAKAAYDAAQSFAGSDPGKVVYYIADDLGDASCNTLNSWISANNIGSAANMTIFSNAGNVIKETDFGGTGMPHVVVIGGGLQHKIYYNKKNGATNDQTGITSAITAALAGVNVETLNSQVEFSMSPNPFKEAVQIRCDNAVEKISVLSVTGQVLKEEIFPKGKNNPVINLSTFATGVYTVQVTDINGRTGTQKLVKD